MVAIEQFDDEVSLCRYDYEDGAVLAADFGPGADVTVDVVDGTAIVVAPDEQYELDLPGADAQAFIRNGVLTIEVDE